MKEAKHTQRSLVDSVVGRSIGYFWFVSNLSVKYNIRLVLAVISNISIVWECIRNANSGICIELLKQ